MDRMRTEVDFLCDMIYVKFRGIISHVVVQEIDIVLLVALCLSVCNSGDASVQHSTCGCKRCKRESKSVSLVNDKFQHGVSAVESRWLFLP